MATGQVSRRKNYLRKKEIAIKENKCVRCLKNKKYKNKAYCIDCLKKTRKNKWQERNDTTFKAMS